MYTKYTVWAEAGQVGNEGLDAVAVREFLGESRKSEMCGVGDYRDYLKRYPRISGRHTTPQRIWRTLSVVLRLRQCGAVSRLHLLRPPRSEDDMPFILDCFVEQDMTGKGDRVLIGELMRYERLDEAGLENTSKMRVAIVADGLANVRRDLAKGLQWKIRVVDTDKMPDHVNGI